MLADGGVLENWSVGVMEQRLECHSVWETLEKAGKTRKKPEKAGTFGLWSGRCQNCRGPVFGGRENKCYRE
jgi:hypothetical protein